MVFRQGGRAQHDMSSRCVRAPCVQHACKRAPPARPAPTLGFRPSGSSPAARGEKSIKARLANVWPVRKTRTGPKQLMGLAHLGLTSPSSRASDRRRMRKQSCSTGSKPPRRSGKRKTPTTPRTSLKAQRTMDRQSAGALAQPSAYSLLQHRARVAAPASAHMCLAYVSMWGLNWDN